MRTRKVKDSQLWEAAKKKRQQLDTELDAVSDPTLRSNLKHSLEKLWLFVSGAAEETGG